ncbi:Peptidoglycan hydrolase flgJ [Serratia fonticola]|uniref:Peptidoglycan hydrolase FlgJ n=1 Tax=Serratia fonticola TaxID=47917 RepID=A0A4U9WK61_SERFO|nr:Peptidoglycan hydrolase flgJ [Serratia fonticola]
MAMSGAAYDTQSLNGLKRDVAADPQGNIKQVAQQVEGMFVQMMLKSMRAALPQDGVLSSDQTRLYTSMYDQQIAQQMSQKGLGAGGHDGQAALRRKQPPKRNRRDGADGTGQRGVADLAASGIGTDGTPGGAKNTFGASLAVEQRQFCGAAVYSGTGCQPAKRYSASVDHGAGRAGVWLGQREIPAADGSRSYNLFGIKAGSSWDGPVTEITTTEFEEGVAKKIKARFRVYGSYMESDWGLRQTADQQPALRQRCQCQQPEQAAHALQKAGYATDPLYAKSWSA